MDESKCRVRNSYPIVTVAHSGLFAYYGHSGSLGYCLTTIKCLLSIRTPCQLCCTAFSVLYLKAVWVLRCSVSHTYVVSMWETLDVNHDAVILNITTVSYIIRILILPHWKWPGANLKRQGKKTSAGISKFECIISGLICFTRLAEGFHTVALY